MFLEAPTFSENTPKYRQIHWKYCKSRTIKILVFRFKKNQVLLGKFFFQFFLLRKIVLQKKFVNFFFSEILNFF